MDRGRPWRPLDLPLVIFPFWNHFQRERELNRELFGNMPFLPMENHKKLFQETGIDIDGKKCIRFKYTECRL